MSTTGFLSLLLLCLAVTINGLTLSSYLTKADKERLRSGFDIAYKKAPNNAKTVSLVVLGYSLLDRKFDHAKEACELFKKVYQKSDSTSDLYDCVVGATSLGSGVCELSGDKSKSVWTDMSKVDSMEGLYKLVRASKLLGVKSDADSVNDAIARLGKKEGGALSQAYGYLVATNVWSDQKELKRYWVDIEDVLQQADEADGSQMYYEGGVVNTAVVVKAIVDLVEVYGETAPSMTTVRMAKIANFLLMRRHCACVESGVWLLVALRSLSRGGVVDPMVVMAERGAPVTIDGVAERQLRVSLSNVWGEPIKAEGVRMVVETMKNVQTAVTVMSRQSAVLKESDKGIFEIDLAQAKLLERGFYSVKMEVRANRTGLDEATPATVVVKVTSGVTVEQAELSVRERDQVAAAAVYKLTHGASLAEKIVLDWHHRLELRFSLKDSQQQPCRPHQVFVRLTHAETRQEVIFVAEADKAEQYKFVLDLDKQGKEFDHESGEYSLSVLLGDALLGDGIDWRVLNRLRLDMPGSPAPARLSATGRSPAGTKRASNTPNPRVGSGPSRPRPLIAHEHRPADPRASDAIATIFTVLCTLPPAAAAIALWTLAIGVNLGLLRPSLPGVVFHGGLAALFGLYYLYWTSLDMFTTLRYLVPVALVTALAGNRVLRGLAALRGDHK